MIVSNDKDFLQLCDEETVVYRPTTDKIETKKTSSSLLASILQTWLLPVRWLETLVITYPAFSRVGFKTIAGKLPFMSEERTVTIDELLDYCENTDSKLKVYKKYQRVKEAD